MKNHREKKIMSVRVTVHISKIMHTPIKVGISMYGTYANCRTLKWQGTLSLKTLSQVNEYSVVAKGLNMIARYYDTIL